MYIHVYTYMHINVYTSSWTCPRLAVTLVAICTHIHQHLCTYLYCIYTHLYLVYMRMCTQTCIHTYIVYIRIHIKVNMAAPRCDDGVYILNIQICMKMCLHTHVNTMHITQHIGGHGRTLPWQ